MHTLTERRTYDVSEAAQALGISRRKAIEEIRRTGKLAGVGVICVGRRILIPKELFDRALSGMTVSGDYDQNTMRTTLAENTMTGSNRVATRRPMTCFEGLLEYADETVNVIIDFRFSGRRIPGRFLIVAMIFAIQAVIVS